MLSWWYHLILRFSLPPWMLSSSKALTSSFEWKGQVEIILDDIIILKWPDYVFCTGEKCNICHWLHLIQLVILNLTFKGLSWRKKKLLLIAVESAKIQQNISSPLSSPSFSSFQMCRWQQLSVEELEKLQQLEKHFNFCYVKWHVVYGIKDANPGKQFQTHEFTRFDIGFKWILWAC